MSTHKQTVAGQLDLLRAHLTDMERHEDNLRDRIKVLESDVDILQRDREACRAAVSRLYALSAELSANEVQP